MGASDFRSSLPSSSLFRLVKRCACATGADDRLSMVTTHSRCEARRGLRSRGGFSRLPMARETLLPAGLGKPSALTPTIPVSGLNHLQGQHHLFPLHLASFCAYASSIPLPEYLQGSMPGPWLAVTWVGFAPTRLRGIATPQPPVRLQGRSVRRCLPASYERTQFASVLRALRGGTVPPFRAGAIRSVKHHRSSDTHRFTPEALAPARVMLSRTLIA